MKKMVFIFIGIFLIYFSFYPLNADISLYWWQPDQETNFGDELSCALVERILDRTISKATIEEKKLLAIGSILHFARNGDVIWGAGINGKHPNPSDYCFSELDVRAVRGPLTRNFLDEMNINCPETYGDPALLIPMLFPEFKVNPKEEYVVIPHISEINLFEGENHILLPTTPWSVVIQKIIEAKFVISSSLHGIIVAEAFGIPARLLRVTSNEPLFKYTDYYLGTGRSLFYPASSIEEAIEMGGEPPPICDLELLLKSFPYDVFKN